jgi:hypothetical protein
MSGFVFYRVLYNSVGEQHYYKEPNKIIDQYAGDQHNGLWTIAFQTSDYQGEIAQKIGKELVNIYVPTTPNPTSGFFIMLAKEEVIELDMSVDEAFKLGYGLRSVENLNLLGNNFNFTSGKFCID